MKVQAILSDETAVEHVKKSGPYRQGYKSSTALLADVFGKGKYHCANTNLESLTFIYWNKLLNYNPCHLSIPSATLYRFCQYFNIFLLKSLIIAITKHHYTN